jgi:hypothetical protein
MGANVGPEMEAAGARMRLLAIRLTAAGLTNEQIARLAGVGATIATGVP